MDNEKDKKDQQSDKSKEDEGKKEPEVGDEEWFERYG